MRMRTGAHNILKMDAIIEKFFLLCALSSILIIGLIFTFLFKEGIQTFFYVSPARFFIGSIWQPVAEIPKYGVLPLLSGSILVTSAATVIALPMSILCATYLAEVSHPALREILKPIIEILAGIPSVVFGFIALTILADFTQSIFNTIYRLNALNGAIILAVMIIPTIVSLSDDAISAIPREYKEAALALGATRWETSRRVVLPAARSGIVVATMLGIGRAIGETMAVLMATGNAPLLTFDLLSSVETMTATIAIEMGEVAFGSPHYHALFAIGLVLFAMTFAVNLVAELVSGRMRGLRS